MAESMGIRPAPGRRTLAEKLDHLFREIHPAHRGPFSYHEVAQAIKQQAAPGGPTVSHGTLQQIRTGAKTNPTVNTLEAIAAFFGVPAAYFLDDTVAERVDERLCELKADLRAADPARIPGAMPAAMAMVPPTAVPPAAAPAAPVVAPTDELADMLADSNIRAVAFRLAGLSPRALQGLRTIVDQVRKIEGLPEVNLARRGRQRVEQRGE
ncbi:helix-turn-helix domain-containing protein [Kitasatospora sp. NPDC052896]|uniref:helix-turn-helix domain-containing protein n=1 Tax=Kitasatospora sp. NPDC052896 TaxID=3364061 RepID=UPI0037CA9152